nr:MAG TPA: hypothetical protein [Caudoviricetes sp.]
MVFRIWVRSGGLRIGFYPICRTRRLTRRMAERERERVFVDLYREVRPDVVLECEC